MIEQAALPFIILVVPFNIMLRREGDFLLMLFDTLFERCNRFFDRRGLLSAQIFFRCGFLLCQHRYCTTSAASLQAVLRLNRLHGSTFDDSPVLIQLLPRQQHAHLQIAMAVDDLRRAYVSADFPSASTSLRSRADSGTLNAATRSAAARSAAARSAAMASDRSSPPPKMLPA